ncbi:ribosomal RNA small subunit methyltransferase A [Candidatus Uhrbacteria bacterium]|nr:ribosomal RNA small subunit methyltransferase A [Candidatus Uhrbacteria bacterium]
MSLGHDIGSLLRAHGMKLNTDWGQHFLMDQTVISSMIKAGDVKKSDTVLEIGAGIGALTKELLDVAGKVIAMEVDRRWKPIFEEYVGPKNLASGRLQLIEGNALKLPYPDTPYKIVANIPYLITSRLIRHALLHAARRPDSLTLLVQREVADKICASKRGETRTILSILVELFGEPSFIKGIPPGAFLPPPKVDSAIIHIKCFDPPKIDRKTVDEVLELTSIAFHKKRKMLRASLGKFHGMAERLEAACVAADRRPETLSIDEWIALAKTKTEHSGG